MTKSPETLSNPINANIAKSSCISMLQLSVAAECRTNKCTGRYLQGRRSQGTRKLISDRRGFEFAHHVRTVSIRNLVSNICSEEEVSSSIWVVWSSLSPLGPTHLNQCQLGPAAALPPHQNTCCCSSERR